MIKSSYYLSHHAPGLHCVSLQQGMEDLEHDPLVDGELGDDV